MKREKPSFIKAIMLFLQILPCLLLTDLMSVLQRDQLVKMREEEGFIAALDQSGGSTPKALKAYGIEDTEYKKGEESMFQKVHDMRTRIMTSPKFGGDRVLGAILFENTVS